MALVRITGVDAAKPATAALLQYLQLKILPNDIPKETSSGCWWIGYDGELGGLPVAFASLHPSIQWGDAGYLSRSGVLPSHRGQGLQKRLLRVRERRAKALGLTWLISDTASYNVASSNNLAACGYKLFRPSNPWGHEDAIYWRKELS